MRFRNSGKGLSGTAHPEQLTKCLKTGSANESFPDLSGSRSRESAGKDKLGVNPDELRRGLSDCKSLRSNSH